MITLDNPRLVKLISEKDALVSEGRKMSRDIESIELKIKRFESKEKLITGKVRPSKEIEERGNKLTEEINAKMKELEKLGKEIEEEKLKAVPEDMKNEHFDLMKQKEKLERERNKIALKVQKVKDKVVPLIQKEAKSFLKDEYDDIETAKIKDGKLVITTFNHIDDFKARFRKRTL